MQQAGLFFYRFRFLIASILTMAFLMLISAVVNAAASNTVLAHPSANSISDESDDSPDIVSDGAAALGADMQTALLSVGSTLYSACHSVTVATVWGGTTAAHGSADVIGGVWDGTKLVGHGIGSGVMFTVRAPGKAVGSIVHGGKSVGSIIKPTDSTPVPIISSETSTNALARYSAQEKQEVAQWQAAQLKDNESLGGTIVASDSNDGGYPAKWADAPQDSTLDSWGMYNRECVSYAAWKVYQAYGTMPYWGGEGNANQWPSDARRAGIPTGSTPRVGSVAIWMVGYYGHAMWVEKVSGNMVYVSQYNYALNGQYSTMWVNGSDFTYIYFH